MNANPVRTVPVRKPSLPVGDITEKPGIKGPSSNFGGNVISAVVEPQNFSQRFAGDNAVSLLRAVLLLANRRCLRKAKNNMQPIKS
jgi:hypothetical protein